MRNGPDPRADGTPAPLRSRTEPARATLPPRWENHLSTATHLGADLPECAAGWVGGRGQEGRRRVEGVLTRCRRQGLESRYRTGVRTRVGRSAGRSRGVSRRLVSGCSCGARVVQGRDVRPRRVRRRRVVVRRFSDPVEVRVRGEGGSGMRGAGGRRMGGTSGAGSSGRRRPPAGGRDEARAPRHASSPAGRDPAGPEPAEDCDPDQPEAFIWRGRLYVVRGVLATWRERRAWWREALDADDAHVRPGETLAAAARERQVWRVEASPGWSFTPGVYDLAHDDSGRLRARSRSRSSAPPLTPPLGSLHRARTERAHPAGDWSLVRVAD